jgi:preprotein translocase subunit YajC
LSSDLAGLLPFVLIALVFWLLIVRPQRRRARDLANTQSALQVGSEVMLTSGIFGRVASLEDQTLHLELSPGTVVKVSRQAVVRVVVDEEHDLANGEHRDDRPGAAGEQL